MNITITDDNDLEPMKSFTVSLMKSEGLSNKIHLIADEAEINIVDDDGVCMYNLEIVFTDMTKCINKQRHNIFQTILSRFATFICSIHEC